MTAVPVAPAGTHAMKSSSARFNTRAAPDTSHCARVAPANTSGTLAMDVALAMDALSMQRGLVRPVRVAHDPAKVEPVIVRNFAPAFSSLVHCYDVVEALAGCISQQVCIL
jgi:hypothetical protein